MGVGAGASRAEHGTSLATADTVSDALPDAASYSSPIFVSTLARSPASRLAPARRLSTSAPVSPLSASTRPSSVAVARPTSATCAWALAIASARVFSGVLRGLGARVLSVGVRIALDLRRRDLGGRDDRLHLGSRARRQRVRSAPGEGSLQLLDLARQRPQMRVHGGGIVPAPADRKVALLDALPVQVHCVRTLANGPAGAHRLTPPKALQPCRQLR